MTDRKGVEGKEPKQQPEDPAIPCATHCGVLVLGDTALRVEAASKVGPARGDLTMADVGVEIAAAYIAKLEAEISGLRLSEENRLLRTRLEGAVRLLHLFDHNMPGDNLDGAVLRRLRDFLEENQS